MDTVGSQGRYPIAQADMRRPMKTADVARYLGQSERNVLRMVHNGQIPAKRLGSQWYYSPTKIAALVGMDER